MNKSIHFVSFVETMVAFDDSWPADGRVFRRCSNSTPFPVLTKAYLEEARASLLRECNSGSSISSDDDAASDSELSPVSTLDHSHSGRNFGGAVDRIDGQLSKSDLSNGRSGKSCRCSLDESDSNQVEGEGSRRGRAATRLRNRRSSRAKREETKGVKDI